MPSYFLTGGVLTLIRYVLERLFWLVITLICVAILIFSIMYFVPGDPASIALGSAATQEDLNDYREKYGLNDPYWVQLGNYLSDTFLHLDLGTSYNSNLPVMVELRNRIPRTLMLGFACIIISAGIGIPMGISCALHRGTALDNSLLFVSMIGISMPNFWLALLMVMLFSAQLGWLPAYGIGGIEYWIMPVIAGSIGSIAMNARQTRSAVLETVRADFVTTARAKGVPERSVTYKHILPNAMIPIASGLGSQFANAIAGTVVIERVFTFPGIGSYLVDGIGNRDYPVVRSCVLVLAAFSAFAMLLVDLFYAYIDPRIKAEYTSYTSKKKGGAKDDE